MADELGMSQDALRQALAESRAGALAPNEERTLIDRVFGRRIIEARFLDFLEHEPTPANPPASDPLKRIIDFLSRDWWR